MLTQRIFCTRSAPSAPLLCVVFLVALVAEKPHQGNVSRLRPSLVPCFLNEGKERTWVRGDPSGSSQGLAPQKKVEAR